MTMDEHEPTQGTPLDELIEQVLAGAASDGEKRALEVRLLADAEARRLYLQRLNLHSALRRQFAYDLEEDSLADTGAPSGTQESRHSPRVRAPRLRGWSWAAAAAVVALIVGIYAFRPAGPPEIATITDLNGALEWIGDGGRVVRGLQAGTALSGGTLESLSADSWAVLTFRDGSTVTVSGRSVLTISEGRQKEMHLREGSISAGVNSQPHGRPMLIHTPTARLEVVGTQLNVDAGRTETTLRVNEGRVRVTRLADGQVTEVLADHQVVASASGRTEFKSVRQPESVRAWQSRLPSGVAYGEWMPGGNVLCTAPMLLDLRTKRVTVHLAAISVAHGAPSPVVLTSGSLFRIRGRIRAAAEVYVGLTAKHIKGGFAGKYVAARTLDVPPGAGEVLDLDVRLADFHLQEEEFPDSPAGLELVDVWCCTYGVDAGLSIASVELLPNATPSIPQPPTEPARLPVADIWTAASQGNLEAVRRHIDAGVDVDATFIAPGIPASGATPLHLAVLADQAEIAEFLIDRGASLGARAGDEHGGTPLHWAAALGRVRMAKRLIDAGADVNATDNHGYTPLDATHYDRERQTAAKIEIAEMLRAKGAKRRPERTEEPGG